MTFKAYIDNIKLKTGKGPDDFRRMAAQLGYMDNGVLKDGVKAGEIIAWLKRDFSLGHGHAMAVVAVLKGHGC